MSMPIWLCIFLMETAVVKSAPKLGHVLFDPLSYEAAKFDELKASILNNKAYTRTTEEETTVIPTSKTFASTADSDAETKGTISTTRKIAMNPSAKPSGNNNKINETSKLTDMFNIIEIALEDIKNPPQGLLNSLRTDGDADLALETREPCAEYEYNGKICKYINNRLLCGYNKNKGELKDSEYLNVGNGCRMHNDRIECGYQKGPFNNPRRPPAWDETHYEDETHTAEKTKNIYQLRKLVIKKTESVTMVEPTSISKDMENTEVESTTDSISVVTETDAGAIENVVTESATASITTAKTLLVTKDSSTADTTTDSISKVTTTASTTLSTESRNAATESSAVPTLPTISDVQNSSPSVKVIRSIIRSNAESSETLKTTASKVKNKRWCVEIGDRIVCHYTKNY